jgi:hypothetical protein
VVGDLQVDRLEVAAFEAAGVAVGDADALGDAREGVADEGVDAAVVGEVLPSRVSLQVRRDVHLPVRVPVGGAQNEEVEAWGGDEVDRLEVGGGELTHCAVVHNELLGDAWLGVTQGRVDSSHVVECVPGDTRCQLLGFVEGHPFCFLSSLPRDKHENESKRRTRGVTVSYYTTYHVGIFLVNNTCQILVKCALS